MANVLQELATWFHQVFVLQFDAWILLGFVAQFFFSMRFLVQWVASEKAKRSVVPIAFWFFSLFGGGLLLIYAIQRAGSGVHRRSGYRPLHLHPQSLADRQRTQGGEDQGRLSIMTEAIRGADVAAKRNYLLLFVFSMLMTVFGLAAMPPLDRDEPRFVQATKQMTETGDYVDIRFQDASRYQKPIGIYWLQSAAVALSGEGAEAPIWVYRLVSALGIAIAVVAVAWTGTNLFGASAGVAAGLVMAAIFATAFEGRDAKTDAMLLACCVLAQGALAQIYTASRRNEVVAGHLPWIFWMAQGAAILIKGPIAPLLSALTVAVLFAFERDWRWLSKLKTARGLALVLLIVLPWIALITWKSGGAFLQQAVGKDMLGKVAQGEESHGVPPGFYVLTYSLFMWPFGLIAVGAGLQALNRLRDDPRLRFCLAWYIPFWLLFELIPTKLPHYVLPAYPGMALLVGWLLTLKPEDANAPLRRWQAWLWWSTAFGLALVTVGLAVVCVAAPIYFAGIFLWCEHSGSCRRARWPAIWPSRVICRCRSAASALSRSVRASPMPCCSALSRRH